MLLRLLAAAAIAVDTASAFRDASPFALFSTSSLSHSPQSQNVASARKVQDALSNLQQSTKCQSDTYIIVSQPDVSAADLAKDGASPNLKRRLSGKDKNIETIVTFSNVVGQLDAAAIRDSYQAQCGAKVVQLDGTGVIPNHDALPQVLYISFPSPPVEADERVSTLGRHDSYLNVLIESLPSTKYTVLYITSPPTTEQYQQINHAAQVYEMDEPYPSSMHIDLKRDVYPRASNNTNGTNLDSNLPLFEKYQFLSSGIFMGGVVSILLLSILYVGISAIAGLEISVMAFSKEMGPAAQKKQQ